MTVQPIPDLSQPPPRSKLESFINKIISIGGIDPYNRDRILRTDLVGNLSVVIASGLGILQKDIRFWIAGSLATATGYLRFHNLSSTTLAFQEVHLSVNTAPVGSSLIVDVNKGTGGSKVSIFTSANRPTILAGEYTGKSTTFDLSTFNDDDYLTFDIDQVGSSTPASDLVITVLLG